MTKAGSQQSTQPDAQPTGAGTSPSLWGRLSQALAPRVASQAPTTERQKTFGDLGRMSIAFAAYIVGSTLLQYLLEIADGKLFNFQLEKTRQTLFPANWPLVGNMSKFALIYMMLLLAYVWLLFRLNVIRREWFRPRNAPNSAAMTAATVTTGRSKSARRRAALTATTTAVSAKHHPTTRRGVAARTVKEEPKDIRAKVGSGDYDAEYDRVRSLNRRRRKH